MRHFVLLACGLTVLLSAQASAQVLDITESRWGLNGATHRNAFVPLTLKVTNVGDRAFEGSLTLSQGAGADRVDAQWRQAVFISPGSTRWVRFDPLICNPTANLWLVSWRDRTGLAEFDVGTPNRADANGVYLDARDATFARRVPGLLSAPAELFPPSVALLDSVDVIALDQAPALDPAQRRALIDWLHLGGVAYVFHRTPDHFDTFSDDLSVLNLPGDDTRVGQGRVVRIPITLTEANRDALNRLAQGDQRVTAADFTAEATQTPKPEATAPVPQPQAITPAEEDMGNTAFVDHLAYQGEHRATGVWEGDTLMRTVNSMTVPDHAWGLISLVCIGYLALVGPVNWFIGRKLEYRVAPTFLVVIAAAFAFAFWQIGKSGYSDVSTTHSITLARPLPGNRFDVTQWSNIFVTDGDQYTISHGGEFNAYSTWYDIERVDGMITTGENGAFGVRIPVYANRDVVHRGVMHGPAVAAQKLELPDTPGHRVSFKLNLPNVQEVFARKGRNVYSASHNDAGQWALDFSTPHYDGDYYYQSYYGRPASPEERDNYATGAIMQAIIVMMKQADDDKQSDTPPLLYAIVRYDGNSPFAMTLQGRSTPATTGETAWVVYALPLEGANWNQP